MPNLVVIEHTQSITYDGDRGPQEHLSISVRFTYEAFSSGWVRENFRGRGGPTDFLVMTAIANHARPLRGEDLRLLVSLGVATEADEGRLYARVTDAGLADELGCERRTIKQLAERLEQKGLIRICELPGDFRDSKGHFNGARAYIISGIPSSYVAKEIKGDGAFHRGTLAATDASGAVHRDSLASTAENGTCIRGTLTATAESQNALGEGNHDHHGTLTRAASGHTNQMMTKIKMKGSDRIDQILSRFVERKRKADLESTPDGPAYEPSQRERRQVQQLLDEGYSVEQLAGAVDQVFASRPKDARPVRSFGLVLSYVHRRLRPAGQPSTESDLTGDTPPTGDRPTEMAVTGIPPATDTERTPKPADDPLAPVYRLLKAASIRGMEGVEDVVYDIPGIRLGLRRFCERHEPFSPGEIYDAVLAAVSRSIQPDRLVGYVEAVLVNARKEDEERQCLQQALSTTCSASIGEVTTRSERLEMIVPTPAGPDKEAQAMWRAAWGELELQMTRATFDTWLKPTRLLSWQSNDSSPRVILGVPDAYVKDWLENRLFTPIQRTLSGIAGNPVEIEFEVHDAREQSDDRLGHLSSP